MAKRLVILFLIMAIAVTFISCTGKKEEVDDPAKDPDVSSETPKDETPKEPVKPYEPPPPPPVPVKTGSAYEADMTSDEGWTLQGKVPEGVIGTLTVEDGKYILSEDEISRPVTIDLARNPILSVTIEEFTEPRLYVRLQIPGLESKPGYEIGYIGFESLGIYGESTLDIVYELEWIWYLEDFEMDEIECTLNVWAHMSTITISDLRIDYYDYISADDIPPENPAEE